MVGEAGTGKSAFAAALAWPEVTRGAVPASFVQAVAFVTEATTPQELARTLAEQLTRSVPHFHEAQRVFAKETPDAEQKRTGYGESDRKKEYHWVEGQIIDSWKELAGRFAPAVK